MLKKFFVFNSILCFISSFLCTTKSIPVVEVKGSYDNQLFGSNMKEFNNNSVNDFMSFNSYFWNLAKYQPNNTHGTCTFVALAQTLSYLDTFLSDDIIPSVYNNHDNIVTSTNNLKYPSPGLYRHSQTDLSKYASYQDYINARSYNDYQAYLIKTFQSLPGNAGKTSIGMNQINGLLNTLYNTNGKLYFVYKYNGSFDENGYSTSTYTNNAKAEIDNSIPVICNIKGRRFNTEEYYAHSVVAYDYTSNRLFGNFGWGEDHTHRELLGNSLAGIDMFQYLVSIAYPDINVFKSRFPHSCRNANYLINGKTFCGTHKIHEHTEKSYKRIGTSSHAFGCLDCSDLDIVSGHDFVFCGRWTCIKCGYERS